MFCRFLSNSLDHLQIVSVSGFNEVRKKFIRVHTRGPRPAYDKTLKAR